MGAVQRDWIIVTEQWRTVPSFPDYEASTYGQIRRVTGGLGAVAGRIMTPSKSDGYPCIAVSRNGKQYRRSVHVLVAEAFHGPRPLNAHVSHLDGTRTNSRPDNLIYEDAVANQFRRHEHGTAGVGEKNPAAKLTDAQAQEIRQRLAAGERQADLGREYGVTRQVIWFLDHGYTWKDAA